MNPRQAKTIELTILAGILCFAFYMAFVPHLNYTYPLHVDEWNNYGQSQALVSAQSTTHVEPFLGQEISGDDFEIGYHLLLAEVKLFTGLSWLQIFRIFPPIIFVLTTLSAYVFGKRRNFGLEAAFFVTLIPTTVRILGPAFLVPVALGLLFFPLVLFLLHYSEHFRIVKAVPLFLFLSFAFLMHPPTGVALSAISGVYAISLLYTNRHSKGWWHQPVMLFAAILIPSLIVILRYSSLVGDGIEHMMEATAYPLPLVKGVWGKFGYIPLILFIIGFLFLCLKGKVKDYVLASCAGIFVIALALFATPRIGIPIMYSRSWLYFLLLASLIAGFGVKEIRLLCQGYLSRHITKATVFAWLTTLLIILPSAYLGIKSHYDEPYYHIMDDKTYEDFVWINANLGDSYQRAVLEPWLALTFPPITGKSVYTYSAFYPTEERAGKTVEARQFFDNRCNDTAWLEENNIDIVYTKIPLENPDLHRLRDNIYILRK